MSKEKRKKYKLYKYVRMSLLGCLNIVIIPLIIAKSIIDKVAQGIPVNWKYKIVPKSPMEQPNKHHAVFLPLRFQVCFHFQWKTRIVFWVIVILSDSLKKFN